MADGAGQGPAIHWRSYGAEDGAPALFLHCALAHGGIWRRVVEAMAHPLSARAFDMPSHGQSGDWDGVSDIHDLVIGIARSRVEDGMHLVGHSFGATVALRLAQELGPRLRSLTLIEPVLFAAARDTAPDAYADNLRRYGPLLETSRAGNWLETARLFTAWWGSGPAGWDALDPERRDAMARQTRMALAVHEVLHEDTKGLLAPGRVEAVAVPVLLMRGGETDPVMAGVHAGLAARLGDVREVVVPGAGHLLPATHPGKVGAALSGFLGEAG